MKSQLAAVWRAQPPLAPLVAALVAVVAFALTAVLAASGREQHIVRVVQSRQSTSAANAGSPSTKKQNEGRHSTGPKPAAPTPQVSRRTPTVAQMVGQRIMVGFQGTTPPGWLLADVRKGEIGGVILMGDNAHTPQGAAAIAVSLQAAARAGGAPDVLIATDQEGGMVRRLNGPPSLSATDMGKAGPRVAQKQGTQTAAMLRDAHVSVDLAPVADVPTGPSFLGTRAFGTSPQIVADAARAFARGIQAGGVVAATAKHFPGLGATGMANTDTTAGVRSHGELGPFAALIHDGIKLVMVSSATYPDLRSGGPAVLSRHVVAGLLRGRLQFRGVTISDDLTASALAPYGSSAAPRAAAAGVDILLFVRPSGRPFRTLLAAAKAHAVSGLAESYGRILSLKRALGLRVPETASTASSGGAGTGGSLGESPGTPRTVKPIPSTTGSND